MVERQPTNAWPPRGRRADSSQWARVVAHGVDGLSVSIQQQLTTNICVTSEVPKYIIEILPDCNKRQNICSPNLNNVHLYRVIHTISD